MVTSRFPKYDYVIDDNVLRLIFPGGAWKGVGLVYVGRYENASVLIVAEGAKRDVR